MPVNTYEVQVRCRLQNASAVDPTLAASVTSSTVLFDAITINGTERDLRDMGPAEKTALTTAFKQMVLDTIDAPAAAPTGPTGGTGNGTISNIVVNRTNAVNETWTITSTNSTNFTVVGSVSGAQAAATLPAAANGNFVDYSNNFVSFRLTAGSIAFHTTAATVFTIVVSGQ